ncbi:PREDICTED: uncharacterized protein LOC105567323 [Vollenhovia emeryi]|uniref:uncharacterized protein LOC105567323 n=1 Tax=Vollenhovia emeryi TaxID=411798 RepID=UPI0005F3FD0E|nr:PREDICTED: uncharacterized protein LOC105567323 [Vollenhovia emeryi]
MAARTGDGGGETPATVLDDNAGIVTTAGPLAESSTSSSSSSSAATTAVPTVILTESTATSAGSLPLTGSQQQSNLHQVHQQQQQQQSRQRVNLIADVVVNDAAGNLNDSAFRAFVVTNVPLANPPATPLLSLFPGFALASFFSFPHARCSFRPSYLSLSLSSSFSLPRASAPLSSVASRARALVPRDFSSHFRIRGSFFRSR